MPFRGLHIVLGQGVIPQANFFSHARSPPSSMVCLLLRMDSAIERHRAIPQRLLSWRHHDGEGTGRFARRQQGNNGRQRAILLEEQAYCSCVIQRCSTVRRCLHTDKGCTIAFSLDVLERGEDICQPCVDVILRNVRL